MTLEVSGGHCDGCVGLRFRAKLCTGAFCASMVLKLWNRKRSLSDITQKWGPKTNLGYWTQGSG